METMKRFKTVVSCAILLASVLLGATSCKPKTDTHAMLWGHWGCEQYISCRTRADGSEKWDTLNYQVGSGHGYELWFNQDGSGRLRLNDSPAFIKEFSCTYEFDDENQQLVVHGSTWLYALYGSLYLDANEVRFDILSLTPTEFQVYWVNEVSESRPFQEYFYLRKITE